MISKIHSYEDLEVFKKAYKVSLEIHKKSLGFPSFEQKSLADPLRRSTKSICANLAEGFGKQRESAAEYRRYIQVAIGSSDEVRVWLKYCFDLGYIDEDQWATWNMSYKEISKMLVGLHSRWQS